MGLRSHFVTTPVFGLVPLFFVYFSVFREGLREDGVLLDWVLSSYPRWVEGSDFPVFSPGTRTLCVVGRCVSSVARRPSTAELERDARGLAFDTLTGCVVLTVLVERDP